MRNISTINKLLVLILASIFWLIPNLTKAQNIENPPDNSNPILENSENFFLGLPPRREGDADRGDNFCSITPSLNLDNNFVLANQLPLFVWKGIVEEIIIINSDTREEMWNYSLTFAEKMAQTIIYQGKPLEVDVRYFYKVTYIGEADQTDTKYLDFTVLSEEKSNLIQQELALLNENLNLSPLELARKRLEFFEQNNLIFNYFEEINTYFPNQLPEYIKNQCPNILE
jgi:hypothetical protein